LQKEMNEWKGNGSRITLKTCRKQEHAVELLSLEKDDKGEWIFPEEEALRNDLQTKYGVKVPHKIMITGYMERTSAEDTSYILVLGINMHSGRSWATGFLAYMERQKKQKLEKTAIPWTLMDEWAPFGMIGLYTKKRSEGVWFEIDSAEPWKESDPLTKQARTCSPCRGWLCEDVPMICFTDLNDNGREEIHIKGRGPDFDDMVVLEITDEGTFKTIFEILNSRGHWERWRKEWIFVGDVTCEGGELCGREDLGNPNCGRPSVYRFDKAGDLKKDNLLRESFYPIEERPAPPGCTIDNPEGIEAWLPHGKFVRYLPSKKE
jgi:hypothetical protein